MPTISDFYGIYIQMYDDDKHGPHFHAIYAEHRASLTIADCEFLAGRIPQHAYRLVRAWWKLHRNELQANWELLRRHQKPERIDGLE